MLRTIIKRDSMQQKCNLAFIYLFIYYLFSKSRKQALWYKEENELQYRITGIQQRKQKEIHI